MDWRYTPLALPLFLGAPLMLAVAVVALRRAPVRSGAWLVGLALALCFYDLGYALELGSTSVEAVRFWLKVQYLGVPFEAPVLLLLVLSYTDRQPLRTRLGLLAFLVVPALIVLLAWTNDAHELIWRDLRIDRSLGFTRTFFEPGPAYRVNSTYANVALFWTVYALARGLRTAQGLFRAQLGLMLLAALVPLGVYFAYLVGGFPPGLDPNPYAAVISVLAAAWGVLQVRLWDLLPFARETVVASQKDAVLVTDRRGRLADLNRSAQELLGVSAPEAVGRGTEELFPELGRLIAQDGAQQAFRTSLEVKARHYDVSIAPIESRAGRIEGHVAVLRDETERRQAESLRDGLVRTLVHDLQNPLTVVTAALDLVESTDGEQLSEIAREHLTMARANAERVSALAGAILDVYRLKSGRMPLHRESVSLAVLGEQAVSLQRPLAEKAGQSLQLTVTEDSPRIDADPELLMRVLQNLIGNALKFTPPGGRIQVRVSASSEGGVELRVEDDGPGIPVELEGQLFQEFVAGPHEGRGSGLGLAFCRLAVEAHGGRISVERAAAGGAAFRVTLPAVFEPAAIEAVR